jgi:hypothetical protein
MSDEVWMSHPVLGGGPVLVTRESLDVVWSEKGYVECDAPVVDLSAPAQEVASNQAEVVEQTDQGAETVAAEPTDKSSRKS